jgi:hypothetical protein
MELEEGCLVCCNEVAVFSALECNHGPICHVCLLKIDKQNHKSICPICKTPSTQVFFAERVTSYARVDWKRAISSNFRSYFYFDTPAAKELVLASEQYRCPLESCQEKKIKFDSFNRLKKHLHDSHARYYCEICYDYSTLTLK